MYKETSRYEKDAKIDYELGVISKEEYEIEMKSVQLIVAGLMIYDKIQEKNPELCGFKADDFDKEENK